MFFERHEGGELAVLVHPEFSQESEKEDPREFKELVRSAGAKEVGYLTVARLQPNPKYFIGSGKVEELQHLVKLHQADIVIFNHTLSPSQERNLEAALECRVIDRTGLILDIFAQRARTHEGKLQVELAQLQHMSTRLIRGWTHLERQKGGIGMRGPGETQLESDRRLLRVRVKAIKQRLEKVSKQREQGRRARRRAQVPNVSFVGYTNAGKSTLFNRITEAKVYAADQLFATLDPTMRRVDLAEVGPAILADTVGFIRHLPHRLVEAFRATLEESASADLLLHIVDSADEERDDNIAQVEHVLDEIGAGELPVLEVFNKLDLLDGVEPHIQRDEAGMPKRVWLSAQTGEGVELLYQALSEVLADDMVHIWLPVPAHQGRLRARLYELGAVLNEKVSDEGELSIELRMPESELRRALKKAGVDMRSIEELCNEEHWEKED